MITRTHDKDSLIDDLYEAQDHLNKAIELIAYYVRATGDSYAEAYLLDHLRIFAGRDHGFLSGDLNLDDLIEQINESDADNEPEDDIDEQPETLYPKTKNSRTGSTLYLLENNNGPILNSFGEPIYVTIPED